MAFVRERNVLHGAATLLHRGDDLLGFDDGDVEPGLPATEFELELLVGVAPGRWREGERSAPSPKGE